MEKFKLAPEVRPTLLATTEAEQSAIAYLTRVLTPARGYIRLLDFYYAAIRIAKEEDDYEWIPELPREILEHDLSRWDSGLVHTRDDARIRRLIRDKKALVVEIQAGIDKFTQQVRSAPHVDNSRRVALELESETTSSSQNEREAAFSDNRNGSATADLTAQVKQTTISPVQTRPNSAASLRCGTDLSAVTEPLCENRKQVVKVVSTPGEAGRRTSPKSRILPEESEHSTSEPDAPPRISPKKNLAPSHSSASAQISTSRKETVAPNTGRTYTSPNKPPGNNNSLSQSTSSPAQARTLPELAISTGSVDKLDVISLDSDVDSDTDVKDIPLTEPQDRLSKLISLYSGNSIDDSIVIDAEPSTKACRREMKQAETESAVMLIESDSDCNDTGSSSALPDRLLSKLPIDSRSSLVGTANSHGSPTSQTHKPSLNVIDEKVMAPSMEQRISKQEPLSQGHRAPLTAEVKQIAQQTNSSDSAFIAQDTPNSRGRRMQELFGDAANSDSDRELEVLGTVIRSKDVVLLAERKIDPQESTLVFSKQNVLQDRPKKRLVQSDAARVESADEIRKRLLSNWAVPKPSPSISAPVSPEQRNNAAQMSKPWTELSIRPKKKPKLVTSCTNRSHDI